MRVYNSSGLHSDRQAEGSSTTAPSSTSMLKSSSGAVPRPTPSKSASITSTSSASVPATPGSSKKSRFTPNTPVASSFSSISSSSTRGVAVDGSATKSRSRTPLHPLAFARVGKTPSDGRDVSGKLSKAEPRRSSSANRAIRTPSSPSKASQPLAAAASGASLIAARASENDDNFYKLTVTELRDDDAADEQLNDQQNTARDEAVDAYLVRRHASYYGMETDDILANMSAANTSPPLPPKTKQFLQWKAERNLKQKAPRKAGFDFRSPTVKKFQEYVDRLQEQQQGSAIKDTTTYIPQPRASPEEHSNSSISSSSSRGTPSSGNRGSFSSSDTYRGSPSQYMIPDYTLSVSSVPVRSPEQYSTVSYLQATSPQTEVPTVPSSESNSGFDLPTSSIEVIQDVIEFETRSVSTVETNGSAVIYGGVSEEVVLGSSEAVVIVEERITVELDHDPDMMNYDDILNSDAVRQELGSNRGNINAEVEIFEQSIESRVVTDSISLAPELYGDGDSSSTTQHVPIPHSSRQSAEAMISPNQVRQTMSSYYDPNRASLGGEVTLSPVVPSTMISENERSISDDVITTSVPIDGTADDVLAPQDAIQVDEARPEESSNNNNNMSLESTVDQASLWRNLPPTQTVRREAPPKPTSRMLFVTPGSFMTTDTVPLKQPVNHEFSPEGISQSSYRSHHREESSSSFRSLWILSLFAAIMGGGLVAYNDESVRERIFNFAITDEIVQLHSISMDILSEIRPQVSNEYENNVKADKSFTDLDIVLCVDSGIDGAVADHNKFEFVPSDNHIIADEVSTTNSIPESESAGTIKDDNNKSPISDGVFMKQTTLSDTDDMVPIPKTLEKTDEIKVLDSDKPIDEMGEVEAHDILSRSIDEPDMKINAIEEHIILDEIVPAPVEIANEENLDVTSEENLIEEVSTIAEASNVIIEVPMEVASASIVEPIGDIVNLTNNSVEYSAPKYWYTDGPYLLQCLVALILIGLLSVFLSIRTRKTLVDISHNNDSGPIVSIDRLVTTTTTTSTASVVHTPVQRRGARTPGTQTRSARQLRSGRIYENEFE